MLYARENGYRPWLLANWPSRKTEGIYVQLSETLRGVL